MDERHFFDQLSSTWDENEILSTPDKVKEILGYIGIQEDEDILDLGTGTGVLIPFLAEKIGKKGSITAVDFSSGMLEKAKIKFGDLIPTPLFLNLDLEKEPIPKQYDHILLYCVYPHLKEPELTLKKLINENLKEKGDISIAFPCGPDFINHIHEERHSDSGKLPTPTELSVKLSQWGFKSKVISDTPDTYLVKIFKE